MFAVDDLDDVVARLRSHGAELVGEIAQHEDIYRLRFLRGPEGIIIGLAEQLSWKPSRAFVRWAYRDRTGDLRLAKSVWGPSSEVRGGQSGMHDRPELEHHGPWGLFGSRDSDPTLT
jgi:hypothetical protein